MVEEDITLHHCDTLGKNKKTLLQLPAKVALPASIVDHHALDTQSKRHNSVVAPVALGARDMRSSSGIVHIEHGFHNVVIWDLHGGLVSVVV